MDALMTPHGITCISSLLNCHKRRSLAVTGVWLQSPVIRLQSPVVCRQRWPPRWCNGMSWILCPLPLTPGRACKLSQRQICRCQARPGSWKCVRKTSNLQHTHTHTHRVHAHWEMTVINQSGGLWWFREWPFNAHIHIHTHTQSSDASHVFFTYEQILDAHTHLQTPEAGVGGLTECRVSSVVTPLMCVCVVCVYPPSPQCSI